MTPRNTRRSAGGKSTANGSGGEKSDENKVEVVEFKNRDDTNSGKKDSSDNKQTAQQRADYYQLLAADKDAELQLMKEKVLEAERLATAKEMEAEVIYIEAQRRIKKADEQLSSRPIIPSSSTSSVIASSAAISRAPRISSSATNYLEELEGFEEEWNPELQRNRFEEEMASMRKLKRQMLSALYKNSIQAGRQGRNNGRGRGDGRGAYGKGGYGGGGFGRGQGNAPSERAVHGP
ncbi:uncharacterized protein LOC127286138 [Leptopilina boulardi]|uniref:uncharacterized protein LOC127286138 n=1 Tax=Leptopilina boulardi TaxID=63433 RepID=UPI0021F5AEA2|nr:uncharacterized protein LOC127286138 [Leptopilina boulardi]